MDNISEEALGSVTQLDVTSSSSAVLLRSSARVSKKKLDSLTKLASPTTEKKDDKCDQQEDAEKTPVRKPTIWPMEDKDLFFEAVNEYGKDFAAMQRYFVTKNKNKGNDVKTKEQIRRFYYRTWAKISSKLHFPPHIQKQTQELYGLINYGELRKKMKVRTKKDALRLNELIMRGFTQLRSKNKTINIRTPRCRILRRLCRVDDQQESDAKLPSSVRIDLMPADNETWSRVQSLAQNPRVRLQVPLQYRISNLIHYLQRRWFSRHHKYKIKVMEGYEGDSVHSDSKDQLVLKIKPNAEVHVAQVNLSHYNSHRICLCSYEARLGKKGSCLEILNKLYSELGTKMKKQKGEVLSEKETKKVEEEAKDDAVVEEKADNEVKIDEVEPDENKQDVPKPPDDLRSLVAAAVRDDADEEPRKEGCDPVGEEHDQPSDEAIEKVKEGWTAENCQALTVGDIYLMVGSDYKLELDYHWQSSSQSETQVPLSTLLSQLVRLARLTRTRNTFQCACGHQCSDVKRPRKDSFGEDGGLQLSSVDTTFRRPAVQSSYRRITTGPSRVDAEYFRAQMDKLTPKYYHRRGRGMTSKTVVIQRTLPISPKTDNGASFVSLKVIPQSSELPGEFQPVQAATPVQPNPIIPKTADPPADLPPSPTPSINTILSETFTPFPPPANFAGGGSEEGAQKSPSPTTMLREGWLSEVTECSLSSLLSHLETPLKVPVTECFESAPPDVETQFQDLLTETSLDYTAKFAALAAKISSESSQ